jgi:hypothetical protein
VVAAGKVEPFDQKLELRICTYETGLSDQPGKNEYTSIVFITD